MSRAFARLKIKLLDIKINRLNKEAKLPDAHA